jgi:hypothetical protein
MEPRPGAGKKKKSLPQLEIQKTALDELLPIPMPEDILTQISDNVESVIEQLTNAEKMLFFITDILHSIDNTDELAHKIRYNNVIYETGKPPYEGFVRKVEEPKQSIQLSKTRVSFPEETKSSGPSNKMTIHSDTAKIFAIKNNEQIIRESLCNIDSVARENVGLANSDDIELSVGSLFSTVPGISEKFSHPLSGSDVTIPEMIVEIQYIFTNLGLEELSQIQLSNLIYLLQTKQNKHNFTEIMTLLFGSKHLYEILNYNSVGVDLSKILTYVLGKYKIHNFMEEHLLYKGNADSLIEEIYAKNPNLTSAIYSREQLPFTQYIDYIRTMVIENNNKFISSYNLIVAEQSKQLQAINTRLFKTQKFNKSNKSDRMDEKHVTADIHRDRISITYNFLLPINRISIYEMSNEELMEYSELLDVVTSESIYENGIKTGWLFRWASETKTHESKNIIGYYIRKNGGFAMEYIQLDNSDSHKFINDKLRIIEIINIKKEKIQSDINDIFEYRKLETLGIVSEYIANLRDKIKSNMSNIGTNVVSSMSNIGTNVVSGMSNIGTNVVSSMSNIGTNVVSGMSNIGTNVVSGVKCFGNYCMSFVPSNSNMNIPSNSNIPSNMNFPSNSNSNFPSNSNVNFPPGYNSKLKKTKLDREQRKQTRKQTYDTLKQRRNEEMLKQQREKRQRTMNALRINSGSENYDVGAAYDSSAAQNLFNRPLPLPLPTLTRNLSTSSNLSNYSKLDLESGLETLHHSDYYPIDAINKNPTRENILTAEPYLNKLRTGEYANHPNTRKLAQKLKTLFKTRKGGSKTRNKKHKPRSTRKSKN